MKAIVFAEASPRTIVFEPEKGTSVIDRDTGSGADSKKLEWFKTINIAGEELTDQELRNAVYAGPWPADAKRYFSKNGCAAYGLASDYMTGSPIRQDYLETAIRWDAKEDTIEEYMSKHQHDENAGELWHYFQSVIAWVKVTFSTKRKAMKSVDWGPLYNEFGKKTLSPAKLDKEVARLMQDEDVRKKSGIFPYVLNCDERHLDLRAFSDNMKRESCERQKGICVKCKKRFELDEMEGDHVKLWTRAEKQTQRTANCCVKTTIEGNRGNEFGRSGLPPDQRHRPPLSE